MKELIIKGTVKDVKAILNNLIERFGKNIKIINLVDKYERDVLILQ